MSSPSSSRSGTLTSMTTKTTARAANPAAHAVKDHAPLPENRAALMALHREARRRRDAAPLMSEARVEAAFEIERIEIQVARIERAMDPPLV
jgi:hypothetical protein